MATVVTTSKISPAPPSSACSLPLVFFDMLWYDFSANQVLLLYDFPCSKSHFYETLVPHLQKSLSLTLSHFLPLAGNIIHPLNPADKPVLRYQSPDSVSFTVAESTAHLPHLTGNHPRNCDDFYSLAPLLPSATRSETSISCPVLAVQATLFTGQGFSIAFVTHHAIVDASTAVSFIRAWALISKMESEADPNTREKLRESNLLPYFDRKAITNINGLDSLYWDVIQRYSSTPELPPPAKLPTGQVRATLVMRRDEIEKLKNLVRTKCVGIAHLSSFTVICALVWVCSAKSAAAVGDDEIEYFIFAANCRDRLRPPLPDNYFGNCVTLLKAELKHGEVKGANGLVTAAKAIGAVVRDFGSYENGVVDGAKNWPDEFAKFAGKRQYAVSALPRFDFYGADFGWGKPSKFEMLFIDGNRSISVCKSRDFEGGIEIGLSKLAVEMDAFTGAFNEFVRDLT